MLSLRHIRSSRRQMRGFSLIEMMISIVIGMIVAAGAITLIVAINQSNSETIQSTRLTQELRTLASVIAEDIKRTRRIDDPVAMVGQGTSTACPTTPKTPAQPCYPIYTIKISANSATVPSCLTYGYSGTAANPAWYNYHSVRLASNSVIMDQLAFDPSTAGTSLPTITAANCPAVTGTTSFTLSSSEIKITSLCFSSSKDTGTCYFDSTTHACALNAIVPVGNEIDVCIAGQMQAGDKYFQDVTRTRGFVQPIFVRSTSPSGS